MQASEQLVGRTAEIDSLDGILAGLGESGFAAVSVFGEPGMGKTRLLTELEARADERGHLSLTGSASELESDVPFWLFVDALDEYLRALEPGRLSSLDEDALAGLATAFPALAADGSADGGQRDERYRMHRGVRVLLETLATSKPVVIVLDDLHWADSGSIEMLEALLRRPPSAPVLLALAMRPRQLPERLRGALQYAEAERTLTRLELAALSSDEARELLGGDMSARDAEAMYAVSGGNPFYLQQLARAPRTTLKHATEPEDVALARLEVPQAVAAALMDELALLPETERGVLEGAAVAGDPFQVEIATVAAGVTEGVAIEALDELLARDLIRETDVPRRFRFRHPLVRAAVYEATPPGWRLGAHERCVEELAARGASAVVRAHHVERCAREGDLGAVGVLQEAAASVGPRAPLTAARLLGAAIRLLPDDAGSRLELLSACGEFQFAAGQFQESYATLLECLRLVPDGAVEERLELISACAGLEHLLGHHEEAHARLIAALDEVSDPTSAEGVHLMLELASDALYRMEYGSMDGWAARALDAARSHGSEGLKASAAGLRALAGVFSGSVAEAEAACAEGAELVDSMPDEELAGRIDWALDTLAGAELYLDRFADAGAHSDRAVAIAEATGQGNVVPILFWAGLIRTGRGQLGEAGAILDNASEIARLANHAEGLVWNLFARSLTATAAGDAEGALRAAEEATETVAGGTHSFPAMGAGVALAAAQLGVDAGEKAGGTLLQMGGGDTLPLLPAPWRTAGFLILTRSLLASGNADDAGRAAERATELADSLGSRTASARAKRAAAEVALDRGDPESAVTLAATAASLADEAGAAIEAALGWMLAGRAHAAADDRDQAVAMFERAAAAFESLGAAGHRGNAERELGRLGRRPHRRSRKAALEGPRMDSLTERELEVARLVVDRKTNPEIAAELFLSPRTVETHIRHLFEKLGVSSRVEVARAVERADRAAG